MTPSYNARISKCLLLNFYNNNFAIFYQSKLNATQNNCKNYKKLVPNQAKFQIMFDKKSPLQDFIRRTLSNAFQWKKFCLTSLITHIFFYVSSEATYLLFTNIQVTYHTFISTLFYIPLLVHSIHTSYSQLSILNMLKKIFSQCCR